MRRSPVVVIDEAEEDTKRRDRWVNSNGGSDAILVAEDVTLKDVRRWLRKALSERSSS